jgi:acetyl-CoA acetyltransferase
MANVDGHGKWREAKKLLDKVYISGVYTTKQGRRLEESADELLAESLFGAIADAGLEPAQVDGLGGLRSPVESASQAFAGKWAEILGHPLSYYTTVDAASASHCAVILHAALAIGAGLAEHVVVLGGGSRSRGDRVNEMASWHGEFDTSWGTLVPSWFALIAQRHMHQYGTTPEQLAEVAVSTRRWASMNPDAIMRKPITIDDVLSSRMISSPLHLLDCCLVNDGAGAVVISSKQTGTDSGKRPINILGGAEEYTLRGYTDVQHDLLESGAKRTARTAMTMAGVTHDDIDVAELYDCFTITVMRLLEDFGFCKPGESGDFVSGGRLGPNGSLPTNTHGGGLSFSHSFSGLSHTIEAVRQLRGECGERQVENANIAIAHSNGGPLALHSTLVLGA